MISLLSTTSGTNLNQASEIATIATEITSVRTDVGCKSIRIARKLFAL